MLPANRPLINMKYDISILIPCYNCSSFLQDCFESIISQDLSGIVVQVLFSDNCSLDDSYAIGSSYCSALGRVNGIAATAYQQNQNIGSGKNIQFLLSRAEGSLVHILCADDHYSSRHSVLKIIATARSNPSASIIIVDDNTQKKDWAIWNKIWIREGYKVIPSNRLCLYFYLYGCFVGGLSGLCIRSDAVAGYMDSMRLDFAYYGDFYALSTMAIRGYTLFLSEDELVFRRVHPHQDSKVLNVNCQLYSESIYVISLLSAHLFGASPPLFCRLYCSILTGFYWIHALKLFVFRANVYPLVCLYGFFEDKAFLPSVLFLAYSFAGINSWFRFQLLKILERKILLSIPS